MNYEEITVNHLFRNKITGENKSGRFESSQKIQELQKAVSHRKPGMEIAAFSGKILEKTPELLNIKLKDVLGNAWMKYRQVEQCLEQGRQNPDETFLVPLIDHTVVSEHHPQLEVSLDEISLGKLDLKILLELKLKGIILKIKGEEIAEVKAGSCQCQASLACEGIPVFEDQSDTWDF